MSGASATFELKDIASGRYILEGYQDTNGDNKADFYGCHGQRETSCAVIEPGDSGLEVRMGPNPFKTAPNPDDSARDVGLVQGGVITFGVTGELE